MRRIYSLLTLALLVVSAVGAASIATIQLRNRPAAEVIPIIEPLLEPGDAISGQGFKIFLRASPQTVAEVRDLVGGLDTAAKTLMISVFQGTREELSKRAVSGSIRIENGEVGADIAAGDSRLNSESGPVHRLRVTAGSEGYIETGSRLPLYSGTGAGGYADATTGFYVLPRVNGERVTLQISPFKNSLSRSGSGNIDTLQADTTVTGRLGEWLPLGGVSERVERSRSDGVGQSSSQGSRQDSIWIRADLVR
jgi:hypothetical protein